MRLFSYNILNGGIGRADPIGEVIEAQKADVVVLVEADDDWVVQRIARRLKMDHVIGAGVKHAVAVLSRFPIAHSVNHAALDRDGPRAWLEAQIETPSAAALTVMAVHLTPRATVADERKRLEELTRVLEKTAALRSASEPHVLVGDFNANAPQQRIAVERCKAATRRAYEENRNMIPRDAVGLLLQQGYVDSLHAIHGDAAFEEVTFTTHEPGQRVDYVFAYGVGVSDAWIETDRLATYASDHYPIGVELASKIA